MAKTAPKNEVLDRLKELVEQARRGNAGLIVISVSTAEQIIKSLEND